MSAVLEFSFQFITMECGKCGIVFAITQSKHDRCKNHGENWYCPNGHCRIFSENVIEKLKRELQWKQLSLDNKGRWLEEERRRSAALRGVNTKLKKRVSHGVCPCCKRTFQALGRHMKTKHPDFATSFQPAEKDKE